MTDQDRHLAVLGLRDPVTKRDIKEAFRRQIKLAHPDVANSNGSDEGLANHKAGELIVSYTWLMDNHVFQEVLKEPTHVVENIANDLPASKHGAPSRDLLGPIFDTYGTVRISEIVWRVSLGVSVIWTLLVINANWKIFYQPFLIPSMSVTIWILWLLASPRDLDRLYGGDFYAKGYPPLMVRSLSFNRLALAAAVCWTIIAIWGKR